MKLLRKIFLLTLFATVLIAVLSCQRIDDHRIPPMPVYIPFNNLGVWEQYGVSGATEYRSFIKSKQTPSGYSYTALSETGFGGVLLVSDIFGDPQAFDLSCPVEMRNNILIAVDPENLIARCDRCGSTYDVFNNLGTPLSGPAAEKGYGLERYHVSPPSTTIPYRKITR